MGRAHIWIRKEDEAAWASIKNKPEWLHEQLRDKSHDNLGLVDILDNQSEELSKQFDELNAEIAKEWALEHKNQELERA